MLIYRWSPHGSKKIEDLIILESVGDQYRQYTNTWIDSMMNPTMITHDQEPLQYDNFLPCMLEDHYNRKYAGSQYYHSQHYKNIIVNMNLRIALMTPLNVYDKVLLCHSEQNSKELKKYEDAGFIGVYYWCHAIIARDWFRYAQYDPKIRDYNLDLIEQDFLVYNRAWAGSREYRLKFVEMLLNSGLNNVCQTSFSDTDSGIHYTDYVFKNPELAINQFDLHQYLPKNVATSQYSADYESDDYIKSGIEVVLETLFDDSRNHLTEKTLRPIACGKPFMLVSSPGSLAYLRSYGFKTFNELIDESYDTISDPIERLTAVISEMKRLSALSANDKKALWQKLHAIANYNKELFFSEGWHQTIENEYIENLTNALHQLEQTKLGS